jgi:hypothetical protein
MRMGVGIATGAFPGAGVEVEGVDSVAVEGEDLMHLMVIHNKMAVIIMTLLHKAVVFFLDIFFLLFMINMAIRLSSYFITKKNPSLMLFLGSSPGCPLVESAYICLLLTSHCLL